MSYPFKHVAGFTLVELLITFGVAAVCIGLGLLIVNPARRLVHWRDRHRQSAVEELVRALSECTASNDRRLPALIDDLPNGQYFQVGTAARGCTDSCAAAETQEFCLDLSRGTCGAGRSLVPAYLPALPVDPSPHRNQLMTGYYLGKTAGGELVVGSCAGELKDIWWRGQSAE